MNKILLGRHNLIKVPFINHKMTSRDDGSGCIVTGNYWHNQGGDQSWQFWNEDSESGNNSGSYTTLALPTTDKTVFLTQIITQGTNGVADRGFYCARWANFTLYKKGVQVHNTGALSLPWSSDKSVKIPYNISSIEFDAISATVGGNPNCPQQQTGGFKLIGYQMR